MARRCFFSGKGTGFGHTRSHSMRQGNRKFKANLFTKTIKLEDGVSFKIKVSSKMYKKMRGII